jgi:hypothetical protein
VAATCYSHCFLWWPCMLYDQAAWYPHRHLMASRVSELATAEAGVSSCSMHHSPPLVIAEQAGLVNVVLQDVVHTGVGHESICLDG